MDKGTISWLVFALVCGILEVATPGLFGFILVGAAAVLAAIACELKQGVAVQLGVFAVAAAVLLTGLRSFILKRMGDSPGVPSRTERLVGHVGRVTEALDPVSGGGRVLVDGHDWAAQASEALAVGTQIRVEGADGIRLSVKKV